MRISYLRQREPIDQIVESTLSQFWTSRFGEECVALATRQITVRRHEHLDLQRVAERDLSLVCPS